MQGAHKPLIPMLSNMGRKGDPWSHRTGYSGAALVATLERTYFVSCNCLAKKEKNVGILFNDADC